MAFQPRSTLARVELSAGQPRSIDRFVDRGCGQWLGRPIHVCIGRWALLENKTPGQSCLGDVPPITVG